jgi:hypothetical protein
MKIAKTGYWSGNTEANHKFDLPLAEAIKMLLIKENILNVLDVGCGYGYYVDHLSNNSKLVCAGIDGNPDTDVNPLCRVHDLTTPFNHVTDSECVLCLEVGEHIPKQFTSQFLSNIKNGKPKVIILSWAIPGQGGDGHVNELPNEDVINMFSEYTYDIETSQKLRDAASLWWFKNTIMVFRKV